MLVFGRLSCTTPVARSCSPSLLWPRGQPRPHQRPQLASQWSQSTQNFLLAKKLLLCRNRQPLIIMNLCSLKKKNCSFQWRPPHLLQRLLLLRPLIIKQIGLLYFKEFSIDKIVFCDKKLSFLFYFGTKIKRKQHANRFFNCCKNNFMG